MALQTYRKNDFYASLIWYEKLFDTKLDNYRNNYNLYRASVSACKNNLEEKALNYFKEMAAQYLDYNNYSYFANDTLALCLKETKEWKNAMAFMKPKYDSVQELSRQYYVSITDTTKRINTSKLNDSKYLKELFNEMEFNTIYKKIKSYNQFSKAPVTNHWALYDIKINDTLIVPFLAYIPNKYDPTKKTPLYIFYVAVYQVFRFLILKMIFQNFTNQC